MVGLAELVADASRYYSSDDPPLQQGDVVLAPVGRVQTDVSTVSRWASFDQAFPGPVQVERDLPELFAAVGYGLAIVVTHDCHTDREFNQRVRQLRHDDPHLSLTDAEALAEADDDLDRFVNVCPLLSPDAYRADWRAIAAGEVIGAFPVPELGDHAIDELVVDLTYRATIDRHSIVTRAAVISHDARVWLKYSLARTDVFRTPTIGFDLEQAVGKRIKAVIPHDQLPLMVTLELSDDTRLDLVHQPADVREGGAVRSQPPGASAA